VYLTPEQYLKIEREAEHKSEYFKGEMFPMAGGTLNHARIVDDVLTSLNVQLLQARRCEISSSDLRLQVPPDGLYTYPDIVVFCGKPRFADPRRDTITDATAIIEVLSPSTGNYDRGFKFEQYRQLASLNDYVVIAQDRVHVEHSVRREEGWMLRETSDLEAVIELPSIGCRFRLRDAYSRVEFEETGGSSPGLR
jgi:Uma2 family endonuclease